MEEKVTFTNTRGDKLVGILQNPIGDKTRPMVIIVHGHSSNKDRPSYTNLAERFNERGLATFRFDLYGHGESEGEFAKATPSEVTDDVLRAIKFIKVKEYRKIELVGSSFGGLAAILAATDNQDILALALKSPVSNYAELFGGIDLKQWQDQGFIPYPEHPESLRLNYIFYTDSVKRDGYKVAPKIKVPTLIVHGDADTEVPMAQSQKLAKLIPHCRLKIIHGADHRYTNPKHAQQMLETISSFILKQI